MTQETLLKKAYLISTFILILLVVTTYAAMCPPEQAKIDLSALLSETRKGSDNPDDMAFIMWLPEEFWQIRCQKDDTATKEEKEEMIAEFSKYIVVMAIDGRVGTLGEIKYIPEPALRNSIRIRDGQGKFYKPIPQGKLGDDINSILSVMKPMLLDMLGPLGKNMHFFVFPSKSENGAKIINTKAPGKVSILLDKREFTWRLPLASLVPPKICPTCSEKLNGAYNFCPWDGTQLP